MRGKPNNPTDMLGYITDVKVAPQLTIAGVAFLSICA